MKNQQLPSNKSLGIVFFIFFIIISLYPIMGGEQLRLWALTIGIIFLILGLINSKILTPLNIVWIKLGLKLGGIISPFIMTLIYFIVVTPIGVLMRRFKDPLNLKREGKKSYWIKKKKDIGTMKNQF
tara:strand:- start:3 stop:383 length:381 start_codon:yes stop_codon:yes gene_type:complete